MKLLPLLHYLEVNLTSFPAKCFFRKNQNGFQRFVFSRDACVLTKSIQQLAIEKWSITLRSDVPFGELRFKIVFLTTTLLGQLNRPCAFSSHLFKNHIEHFDVAMQHSLSQTGN